MAAYKLNGNPFDYTPEGLGLVLDHLVLRDDIRNRGFYTHSEGTRTYVELNPVILQGDIFDYWMAIPRRGATLLDRLKDVKQEMLKVRNQRTDITTKVVRDIAKERIVVQRIHGRNVIERKWFGVNSLESLENYLREHI